MKRVGFACIDKKRRTQPSLQWNIRDTELQQSSCWSQRGYDGRLSSCRLQHVWCGGESLLYLNACKLEIDKVVNHKHLGLTV